jgi:hypothetical protein
LYREIATELEIPAKQKHKLFHLKKLKANNKWGDCVKTSLMLSALILRKYQSK